MLVASLASAFPWSIDMYRGEAVQPMSVAPRVMPSDTLPVHGDPPSRIAQMAALKNPLEASAQNLAHGQELYANNCAPCHGDDGAGNGSVVHLLKDHPKNIVSGSAKNLPDGYIYAVIRNGIALMPSYADAMSSDERWQVVLYLRSMQQSSKDQDKSAKQ